MLQRNIGALPAGAMLQGQRICAIAMDRPEAFGIMAFVAMIYTDV
jgi:hypothetical protein